LKNTSNGTGTGLKRDLGSLEAYAVLVGILVGAGIFRVTSGAALSTGPSVILGYMLLAPVILATSVAYLVFLSTPLGLEPGGEVLHISRTFKSERLTFLSGWLKLVSYLGAGAYLTHALAVNLIELAAPGSEVGAGTVQLISMGLLLFFLGIQLLGVRWFGRMQVAMCLILAISLVILIVPGLFAIELSNYKPFFTGGSVGFGASLPSLFFAYAGFEALSQAAGEVRDSQTALPRIFVRGILATTAIFLAMSVVAFGVLPADQLAASDVPMSTAAASYLPFGAQLIVTLGAIMAVATSLNATMLVPGRLAFHMAREGHLPKPFEFLHASKGTPNVGLFVSFGCVMLLIISGRMDLALGIAVVALMSLYTLHSVALILLPKLNPELHAQVTTKIPRALQLFAAWGSVLALLSLIALRFSGDLARILETPLGERWKILDLTSLELILVWVVVGLLLARWSTRRRLA
jgi:APA family basic amino acid/polyamine antiporter